VNSPASILSSLDLDGALRLFLSVKHTRLEGLIIEYEFEQTFVRSLRQQGWRFLDALVLLRVSRRTNAPEFIVLDREGHFEKVRRMLSPTRIPVREVVIDGGRVLLLDDSNGERMPSPQEITASDRQSATAPGTIDDRRVKAMFWGFGSHLGEQFVQSGRDLVLKDRYVGPGYYLWDVDRLCISPDGKPFLIETKHKYPIVRNRELSFGLNVGEFRQFRMFAAAGITVVHVVLVKPRWDKLRSSMYLFFDRAARERAVWLAADLTEFTKENREARQGAASTSLFGSQNIDFVSLPLQLFSRIGINSSPIEGLAGELSAFLSTERRQDVHAEELWALRIR
jgi:hypothetical protein